MSQKPSSNPIDEPPKSKQKKPKVEHILYIPTHVQLRK